MTEDTHHLLAQVADGREKRERIFKSGSASNFRVARCDSPAVGKRSGEWRAFFSCLTVRHRFHLIELEEFEREEAIASDATDPARITLNSLRDDSPVPIFSRGLWLILAGLVRQPTQPNPTQPNPTQPDRHLEETFQRPLSGMFPHCRENRQQ